MLRQRVRMNQLPTFQRRYFRGRRRFRRVFQQKRRRLIAWFVHYALGLVEAPQAVAATHKRRVGVKLW